LLRWCCYTVMEINCTQEELMLFRRIGFVATQLQVDCYLIGGFVRDKILGRPTKDADLVCTGDGIALAEKVAATFPHKPQVNFFKNFGTAQFRIHGFDVEFVGARKESYREDSRKPDVEPGTIADDQLRRDFTVNALAVSLNKADFGKFIDPFNGLEDLQNKILRTPLNPDTTFSDDPLRMMRCARFASQLGFKMLPEVFASIKRNKDRLKIVSQERITDELNKILNSPKPSVGLDLLYRTGLLQQFFPQLADLAGVEIIEGKGHKDNFYHTLQVVDNVADRSSNLWLRWAAVLHDIAKPATKRFEEGHGWTFHGHDALGEKMTPRIFKILKLPQNENMKYVAKLVGLHLRPISLSKDDITDSAMRRLLFDAGADLEDLMILCESDITSKNPMKVRRFLDNFETVKERLRAVEEKDSIRNWQPPISGDEIMKIFSLPPSRPVGILKNAIRDGILDGIIPNSYTAAYELLLQKAGELGLEAVPQGDRE
jgi:poly(A) polymerase